MITIDEVGNAIKEMTNAKSPGNYEIPVEIVKSDGEWVLLQIQQICNIPYVSATAPSD